MEMPESRHEAAYAMNRFLASAIGTMNALIAIVLLATTVLLFVLSINEGSGASTVILIGGVLGTVMLCGLIAILDDIRVTLHEIRDIANPRFPSGRIVDHGSTRESRVRSIVQTGTRFNLPLSRAMTRRAPRPPAVRLRRRE